MLLAPQDIDPEQIFPLPQTGGIMSDQGAQQPLGRLEPPEGATLYETVPLAGGKRRRADDDGFDWVR